MPTEGDAAPSGGGSKLLFDIAGADPETLVISKQEIERLIPHRGQMSLLDGLIWHTPDFGQGLARKRVRHDEFWVDGHFPHMPLFPGVMMIETAAQLACFLFVARKGYPLTAVFLRIDNAVFRAAVKPGEDLLVLCSELKRQKRRFISNVQGVTGGRIVFEAQLTGMSTETDDDVKAREAAANAAKA